MIYSRSRAVRLLQCLPNDVREETHIPISVIDSRALRVGKYSHAQGLRVSSEAPLFALGDNIDHVFLIPENNRTFGWQKMWQK